MHIHQGSERRRAAQYVPAGRLCSSLALGFLLAWPAAATPTAGTRSIFMNGVDISSARSQELRNVDVIINERGDIFVVAPHYQVNEEDTYVPLSQYVQGMDGNPVHSPPRAAASAGGPLAAGGLIPKPNDAPVAKLEMSDASKVQSSLEGSGGDSSGPKATGAVEQTPPSSMTPPSSKGSGAAGSEKPSGWPTTETE